MLNNVIFVSLLLFCWCGILNAGNDCGKTFFSDVSGTVQSPSYPDGATKTTCTYLIDLNKTNMWIKLRFDDFHMDSDMPDCRGDFIEVSTGCGLQNGSWATVSKFCSRNMATKPHMIFSRDGCIHITYESSSKSRGFTAVYNTYGNDEAYEEGLCPTDKDIYAKSGVIASPGWPRNYSSRLFLGCEWDIKVPDSSHVIKLNFMDLDLYNTGLGGYCKDKLKITGEKSSIKNREEHWNYCSAREPFSIITDYYELEVEMDMNFYWLTSSHRGFIFGWVAYEDERAAKNKSWGYILGGVVIVIILCIVGFCLLRSYKRRRNNSRPAQVTTTTSNVPTTNPTMQFVALNDESKSAYPSQSTVTYVPAQPAAYPSAAPIYPPSQGAGYPPPRAGYPPPGQPAYPLAPSQPPPAYAPNLTPAYTPNLTPAYTPNPTPAYTPNPTPYPQQ